MDPLRERLLRRVRVEANGCWTWTGRRQNAGYGRLLMPSGGDQLAHRLAYQEFVGPIPEGMTLDHLCHTRDTTCVGECAHRRCVNPAHLEPVPNGENVRRGRKIQDQLARTHCPQGHVYSPANTKVRNGSRYCRTCARDRARADRALARVA